jgi:hypothetical protein
VLAGCGARFDLPAAVVACKQCIQHMLDTLACVSACDVKGLSSGCNIGCIGDEGHGVTGGLLLARRQTGAVSLYPTIPAGEPCNGH